ncbi:hypothetical protein EUGRSUZ_F01923 [Eucalyptus grandis]|uniref:Uncharacterized protein n=2 Tax=Eucalyptus grandis TaxID=71139 RepID=A0ACC3KFY7_EUCGR|nr:hypothetical protein EUGRSUZ_F01923 [Eucalyptus grandis]
MALALATFTVKDISDRTCGNMSVPFPSGLDESCSWNSYLVLSRNHTSRDLSLGDDILVLDISVENGTMTIGQYRAFDCYDESGRLLDDSVLTLRSHWVKTGNIHSHFSDTQNKTSGSGCFSYCREDINFIAESYCSGYRCCETSIPRSLGSLYIFMSSSTNYTSVQDFSSCGSAFLVGQDLFNVSDYRLPIPDDMLVKKYSKRCPGLDIDECKDPRRYPLHGNCKNTPRNYTCDCPFGMTGDGKVGCQISSLATTAAVIVSITLSVVVSGPVFFICKRRAKERYVRKNGGEILKHQRVKIFTEAQSAKATNHYDTSNKLGEGGFASIYKGRIDSDVLFAVKKPKDVLVNKSKDMNKDLSLSTHDEFLHEISIISQVNHKNLVKLLGICLETNVPLLVYEFIPNGTLYHHIHDKRSIVLRSWKNCLRIASEATLALEYLHSLADSPVIHSDVKSLNTFR